MKQKKESKPALVPGGFPAALAPVAPVKKRRFVQLKNTKKPVGIMVFNLPHAVFCTEHACACSPFVQNRPERLPDGSVGVRQVELRIAGSITILAKKVSEPISERVLLIPEVREAQARGDLSVIECPSLA